TLVLSTEPAPSLDGERAWGRRARHETEIHAAWRRAQPAAERAPAWIGQLVLNADQFVARRPLVDDPDGLTVIAGYHWFGDWGRRAPEGALPRAVGDRPAASSWDALLDQRGRERRAPGVG